MLAKVFRYILIVVLLLFQIGLGYLREDYILNLNNPESSLVLRRLSPDMDDYPMQVAMINQGVYNNPKWLSTITYTLGFAFSSIIILFLIYLERRSIYFGAGAYFLLLIIIGLLITISTIVKSYTLGYGMAQHVKNFCQSPLMLIVLIIVYKTIRKEACV